MAKEDTQWGEGILRQEEAGAVKSESNLKASNWKGSEKTEVGEPRSQGKTDTTSVLFWCDGETRGWLPVWNWRTNLSWMEKETGN